MPPGDRLKPKQREDIHLLRLKGHGYQKIANETGIPKTTVEDYLRFIEGGKTPPKRTKKKDKAPGGKPDTKTEVLQPEIVDKFPGESPDTPPPPLGTPPLLPDIDVKTKKQLDQVRTSCVTLFGMMVKQGRHKTAIAYANQVIRSIQAEVGIVRQNQFNLIQNFDPERMEDELRRELTPQIERDVSRRLTGYIREKACEKCVKAILGGE